MLNIRLETWDGAEYTLPVLVRWELEYTGGVPCDSMTAVCLYDPGMAEILPKATRFTAHRDGGIMLRGVVDAYEISLSERGLLVTVEGRGMAALLLDTPLDSVLCGLFGAFTAPGIVQIYKYFMWGRSPEYRAKLEEEQIDLRDERKEMLRNKSGRIAYVIGLLAAAVSMTAFSVLGTLGIVSEAASRLMISR